MKIEVTWPSLRPHMGTGFPRTGKNDKTPLLLLL